MCCMHLPPQISITSDPLCAHPIMPIMFLQAKSVLASVKGHIALVRRGQCDLTIKASNVFAAGAQCIRHNWYPWYTNIVINARARPTLRPHSLDMEHPRNPVAGFKS